MFTLENELVHPLEEKFGDIYINMYISLSGPGQYMPSYDEVDIEIDLMKGTEDFYHSSCLSMS